MIDMTSQMMHRISNLNDENQRISYQLSTGKVLENGSDDTILYGRVLNIEDDIRVYDGLKLQINKTMAQNTVADSSISELKTSIDLIKVDLMKALNSGMDDGARHALAVNIKGIRENLFTISNTTINGEHVFSGSNTTAATFVKDANFNLNGKITYGGDGVLRKIAVEPNAYRDRGVTGYDTLMYNANTAGDSEILEFTANERVIDENGQEWKFRQVDTISFANIEKDDIFKVTIAGKEISVTATDTTANTTANLLMQAINLDATTSANVVATVDSNDNLVLTAKEGKNDFSTTISTTEAGGNDTQYMLLNSAGKLLQYEKDGTRKEPTVNRIDTLTVAGVDTGDKFKITIDDIAIEVTATSGSETDMAEAIKDKINQNSTLFNKYYVVRNNDTIVIKPRSGDDTYKVTTAITNDSGDTATFNKTSVVSVTNPTGLKEIDVDAIANRTDTIGVGGTFEAGDKFIVTINGKKVSVDAETDNATTASKIVTALNTNSDTKDVIKAKIDPNDNTKIIITGKTNSSEFSTSVKTTEINGGTKDDQIFTINTAVATGDDVTAIAKYKTKTGEITGSQFLEAKHSYFDDLNVMINALNGYSTKIDGTKGSVASDSTRDSLIREALGQTSKQYDASNIGHSELGGRNHAFNIALERVTSKVVHYNILLQEVGGADVSKLAMQSKSLEMTYQALYSTVSKMHSLSLLNFIK